MAEEQAQVLLDEQVRKRIALEEQLKAVSKPMFSKRLVWTALGMLAARGKSLILTA